MPLHRATLTCLAFILVFPLCRLGAQEQTQRQNRPSEQTQQAPTKTAKSRQARGKPVTITGCLQKDDEVNGYVIAGENGKKQLIRSTTITLGDHVGHKVVGHKVKVKGNIRDGSATSESGGEKSELNVTGLKMLSHKCP